MNYLNTLFNVTNPRVHSIVIIALFMGITKCSTNIVLNEIYDYKV